TDITYANAKVEYPSHDKPDGDPDEVVRSNVNVSHRRLPPCADSYTCGSYPTGGETKWHVRSPWQEHTKREQQLPERIGWTLLSRIAMARRRESLPTALSTTSLEEKMRANLSWKTTTTQQLKRPITVEVTTETPVANWLPCCYLRRAR
ncbi:hypothetical protein BHE74_00050848, partial [Ensete ventricosum]